MNIKYLRNNIGFRRNSAMQYAEFYSAKAFMLGEILDGEHSDLFSPSAREILLQYLSAADVLLRNIENTFIACSSGCVTPEAASRCERYAKQFVMHVHKVIDENPDDFDPVIAKPWLMASRECAPIVLDVARQYIDGDISTAFASVMRFATRYLNHIMFALHELMCLVHKERPILYLSVIDIHVQVKKSFSLPSVRLEAYRRAGLLDDHAELKVLREVEDDYLKADERRWVAYRTILESVSIFNIKLS